MLKLYKIRSFLNVKQIVNCRYITSENDNKKNNIIKPNIEDQESSVEKPGNPLERTINILQNDMKTIKNFITKLPRITRNFSDNLLKYNKNNVDNSAANTNTDNHIKIKSINNYNNNSDFQSHCDVLIIGGAGIGSSVAFWIKQKTFQALNVVVVEMDPTYGSSSTALSVGGIRQQFSLEENIQMSLFGADFIRNSKEYLGSDIDLNFTPYGYLLLASEESAETLKQNSILQNELGARNEILTKLKLQRKFPWLNTDGITLGCHGLEKEGWFDPWALLMGFKRKAIQNGTHYINGEVIGFERSKQEDLVMQGVEDGSYKRLDKVIVKLPNGERRTIKFSMCVLAAGAQSGKIARMAEIGMGTGILNVPLPVEPRKRYVYVFETQGVNCPGLNTPLTIDPTNTYFRREGLCGLYLGGRSPSHMQEPSNNDLTVDYEYFNTDVWPNLAKRVPAFESIKVKSAWAGFYEYNTYDENGIIGPHPYYNNLFIAAGFSGHGIQHAPAVGRAISEIMFEHNYQTIDLQRLSFDRLIVDQPMYEKNIV